MMGCAGRGKDRKGDMLVHYTQSVCTDNKKVQNTN